MMIIQDKHTHTLYMERMKSKIIICLGVILYTTSAFAANAVSFITFGDWGSGSKDQYSVAVAAERYCAKQPCQFVLTLGDNFYSNGVSSVHDPKWQTDYKDMYAVLHLPFYAVIGNHDEAGSIQAQIDYNQIDPTWHLPAEDYSIRLPRGAEIPIIEIFIINNGDRKFQTHEKAWLVNALAKSHATWKILAMHEPIISNGSHGDDPADINNALVPVICNKIDLVLSGHDHLFSHLKGSWKGCAIDQLIVGTGGKSVYSVDTKDPRVLSTGAFYGFGWLSATPEALTFKMVKTDGSVFYDTTWRK